MIIASIFDEYPRLSKTHRVTLAMVTRFCFFHNFIDEFVNRSQKNEDKNAV